MRVRDAEEPVGGREVFGRELVPGEQVLWSGRPDPRRLLDATDVYVIPFSLLWGGFAIFWEILAIQAGDLVGELWGIPFVLVALYLIAGRFLFMGWKRRRTTYAVTSRRAIIGSKGWVRDLDVVERGALAQVVAAGEQGQRMGVLALTDPAHQHVVDAGRLERRRERVERRIVDHPDPECGVQYLPGRFR